jgi:hypothetical protein
VRGCIRSLRENRAMQGVVIQAAGESAQKPSSVQQIPVFEIRALLPEGSSMRQRCLMAAWECMIR